MHSEMHQCSKKSTNKQNETHGRIHEVILSRQVSSKDAFRQNLAHVFQPQPSPKQTLAHVCPVMLPVTSPRNTGNQMGKRSAPVVAHKPSGLGHRRPCYLKISKYNMKISKRFDAKWMKVAESMQRLRKPQTRHSLLGSLDQ